MMALRGKPVPRVLHFTDASSDPLVKILSVKDLSVVLDGNTILERVSFDVEEGDILAILGPNGSGKTVLLKAILGILPHEGIVRWEKPARMGYVPQRIDADRHLPMNLRNLLRAKLGILGLPASDLDHTVAHVGITPEILGTPIGHLSGGEFQRALIAFALLGGPDVLMLDEPTASIDVRGEEALYDLLQRLHEEHHFTALLVSHDLSVVYRYATQVLCLNRTALCCGPPREVLTPEALERLYGAPRKYHAHVDDHDAG